MTSVWNRLSCMWLNPCQAAKIQTKTTMGICCARNAISYPRYFLFFFFLIQYVFTDSIASCTFMCSSLALCLDVTKVPNHAPLFSTKRRGEEKFIGRERERYKVIRHVILARREGVLSIPPMENSDPLRTDLCGKTRNAPFASSTFPKLLYRSLFFCLPIWDHLPFLSHQLWIFSRVYKTMQHLIDRRFRSSTLVCLFVLYVTDVTFFFALFNILWFFRFLDSHGHWWADQQW